MCEGRTVSTLTSFFNLIKPDPTEASGSEELAENMIKTERALINLEVGSNTGRQNLQRTASYRNVSDNAVNLNTEGAFDDLTWFTTDGTSEWTTLYDVDGIWGNPSLGLFWHYTNGSFDFNHPGYYKVTWNLRLQASNITMSEGFVRAALLGTDGYNSYGTDLGIIGSPMVIAMNTMTNLTDIGAEQLVKVTQVERTTDGTSNATATGKNLQPYYQNTGFFRYFAIAFAHNNTSSATLTPLLNESYIYSEFIRGL